MLNKKFKVQQGSTITWFGDPAEADININAIYELKASLYDIMAVYNSDRKNEYKNRTDVICYMKLTGNLMQPNIDFAIELPRADQEAKTALQNIIKSEEDLNQAVASLNININYIARAYMTLSDIYLSKNELQKADRAIKKALRANKRIEGIRDRFRNINRIKLQ